MVAYCILVCIQHFTPTAVLPSELSARQECDARLIAMRKIHIASLTVTVLAAVLCSVHVASNTRLLAAVNVCCIDPAARFSPYVNIPLEWITYGCRVRAPSPHGRRALLECLTAPARLIAAFAEGICKQLVIPLAESVLMQQLASLWAYAGPVVSSSAWYTTGWPISLLMVTLCRVLTLCGLVVALPYCIMCRPSLFADLWCCSNAPCSHGTRKESSSSTNSNSHRCKAQCCCHSHCCSQQVQKGARGYCARLKPISSAMVCWLLRGLCVIQVAAGLTYNCLYLAAHRLSVKAASAAVYYVCMSLLCSLELFLTFAWCTNRRKQLSSLRAVHGFIKSVYYVVLSWLGVSVMVGKPAKRSRSSKRSKKADKDPEKGMPPVISCHACHADLSLVNTLV